MGRTRRLDDDDDDDQMQQTLFSVTVSGDAGRLLELWVYPSIPVKEVQASLMAVYKRPTQRPIAMRSRSVKKHVYWPLSMLSKRPSDFANGVYDVVWEGNHVEVEEDDEDDHQDEEEEYEEEEEEEEFMREIDLTDFELPQLVNVFTQACPTGALDRTTFERCLDKILSQSGCYDPQAKRMFSKLFDVFDRQGAGVVDTAEFLGGLSVFASGERDEKIRFTFDLYDLDNDGFITLEEMIKYLTSVFLVIAETSPELFQQNNVNPMELGGITARQCFAESTLNEDGKLSYEEFQKWYSKPGPTELMMSSKSIIPMKPTDDTLTIDRLRDLTGLSSLSADDLFAIFSSASSDARANGKLTREDFKKSFFAILNAQKKKPTREIARFLDRLFTAFDVDGNGTVDFMELTSGLSVLCGGSQDEKIMAAFALFDADGDGFITQDEMQTYLASVFQLMYETNPAIKQQMMPMDPRTLAFYTTKQAFEEADLNDDDRLSLEEFRKWYSAGLNRQAPVVPPPPPAASSAPMVNTLQSIDWVATLTGLRRYKASQVFEIIAAKVNEDGMLSREAFHQVFDELLQEENDKTHVVKVLDALFTAFDDDQDDYVDFCELSSGLSILCDGEQGEKIKAAFALFDINQDGFISREEMETYLASVYRVIFTTTPAIAKQMRISPEALAQVTTEEAFAQADANHDDRLSFQEFTKWYTSQQLLHQSTTTTPVVHDNKTTEADNALPMLLISSSAKLKEMKALTNLGAYDVNDIVEFFQASANSDGELDQSTFFRCFNKLLARTNATSSNQPALRTLLSELFELFDTDQNGMIDVQELGAGLSILCGGSLQDKAKSLFTLYDVDRDGFVSPEEMMAYLTAVYKVLYKASPDLWKTNLTPEALAKATADHCFATYDRNQDRQLSLQEFRAWFDAQNAQAKLSRQSSGASASSANVSNEQEEVIPMDVAKTLSGLQDLPLDKVAQLFASCANENGLISRQAFDTCFYKYLCASKRLSDQDSRRLHQVIDRLFVAFDTDRNGFVDFNELSSGLSVLCGGTRDEKVQAAFQLYDADQDGLISEEEMVHYLASVFKLLYALDPTRQKNLGISADDLALVTAAEVFVEADVNHDGKLNFEEFQRWYAQPAQASFHEIVAPLDLNEVRRLTNLGNLDVVEVFERFAEHANESGVLTREAFDRCFLKIIESASHPRTDVEKLRAKVVADRLFEVFDRDRNGKIDFSELASGLSVLCKGARDAKVKAAFHLYDFNGDGFISMDEMARYLTSIFRVLYEIQPDMKQETGVSAEELGQVTAEQAFLEADVNRDGKLNFDEFLTWYASPSIAGISSAVAKNAVVDSSLRWMPLNEIKQLTNLHQFTPDQVFEFFAEEANEDGLLSRQAFNQSFRKIISAKNLSEAMKERIKDVVNGLFDLFDADRSGYVDFGELASGLSVLCGGSRDEKVQAAFRLFDFNSDGFISLDEMARYLTSVFRVLYQVSPDTQTLGVSPEELGQVTAQQAFAEADRDQDGRLTLEEFQQWYQQPGGIGEVAKNGEQLFSIAEARRLTNLESFSPMQVFEALADCADDQGLVSKEAFDACFHKMSGQLRQDSDEYQRLSLILNRLFTLFDTDKNGRVDFSELSSGLSVFCGGTSEEKVRAAFELYDYNGDGFISKEEMTRYLTSVFKVLKETSIGPSTAIARKLNYQSMTAEELGASVAEQAFADADLDRDGRLSLDEFRQWYTRSSTANIERLMEHTIPEWLSLREVRRLTNLRSYAASDVFETFASFASTTDGTLDHEAFRRAFEQLTDQDEMDQASKDRLRLVVDRLFDLFDADHNGLVDFSELASGLSILCGGSHDDKVRTAFALYDVNQDGFISLGEMRCYLTSVFKVLFEVNPETQTQMNGISPEELGEITAEQAFAEADLDKDGKLSFEEFKQWYSSSSLTNQSHVPDWVSLQVVKKMTHLERYAPAQVFEVFATQCSSDGTISRRAFEECFEELVDAEFKQDAAHLNRLRLILDRLFTIFDADGNGVVDFCELSSGLSVLCGGTREDKVRAAFALYDLNQDGFISLDEMVRYLTSVFKVLYETSPGTQTQLNGVTPEDLARITAEQCFLEADLNHDGRLSLDEFVKWYSQSSSVHQYVEENDDQVEQPDQEEEHEEDKMLSLTSQMNGAGMERVRQLLKLDAYEVNDVLEIFAEAAPSGELSFASFKKCFDQIMKLAGGHESTEDRQEADRIIRRLFRAFDTDGSNSVDFGELASGLSVLSGSSMEDKVRAAFQLYDLNGDGYISLEEMTSYMTSIFKVMYETSDHQQNKTKTQAIPAEELARATALQCFQEADLNHDNKLSFEEFKKWCTSG